MLTGRQLPVPYPVGSYTVDYEGLGIVDLHAGLSETFLAGKGLLSR